MRTIIASGHVRDVVARRIGQHDAATVCQVLRTVEHIPVTADVGFDGTVHLRPRRCLSSYEEMVTLRAFCACTDARLVVHEAVA